MTDLIALVDELKRITQWQRTPQVIDASEYTAMVVKGIQHLYVLTGRGEAYKDNMVNWAANTFSGTLNLTEKTIVLAAAQIDFFEKVRADKNAIVGYTTDALSVTNADKPYQYLSQTIDELRQQIRIAYYKLNAFVLE